MSKHFIWPNVRVGITSADHAELRLLLRNSSIDLVVPLTFMDF